MKTNSLDFDAQALREKILDLAMRGKLVPQDPNDEPASVLLEKIKAEKAELIKEKKIKKTKPLPPITDDEKPFDIPDSWEWVRLGDVIKPEVHKKPTKNFTYIDIASVDNKKNQIANPNKINIAKDKIASRARQELDSNDILFSVVRPYLKNIALVPDNDEYKVGSTGFYVLKPFKLISRKYIFYLVLSEYVISKMTQKMKGDNSPSIRKGDLQGLIIPLPPLSEQSRIAAKIAQLFALLRKVETSTRQYAKLQTLLKSKVLDLAMRGKLVKQDPNDEPASVLLEKIKAEKQELIKEKKIKKTKPLPPITDDEKPFAIPDSWEWIRLGDLVAPVEYAMADGPFGSNLKKADYTDQPEVRIVQLSNIGENGWKDDNVKYTTFEHLKLIQRSEVFPGNIVIAKMMPAGRAILIPNKDKKYVLSSDAVKFIPNDLLNKQFLLDAINSNAYRNQVNQKLQGTTRPRTSLKKLKNFILPTPPLEEQERITREISELLALTLM
ncbi:restriction endonuclease subunit S [Lactobacillus helveticus]|uniref:restriction endonuclease subunit S n=1 Tax=Lactobacillus helveticus TaxID=1587 RepID=UPI0021A4B776|nr:restriction endonuclease subunit S [Lactobacillus helveticus]MCT3403993.1 restriction endonuclease subunit S [Lactobacillus helveticus]